MRVTLMRKTTGREIVERLQGTYGSCEKLERLYKSNPDNMKVYTDLNDYSYYTRNPEEAVEETRSIFLEKPWLDSLELELLDCIRNQKLSLEELAGMKKGDQDDGVVYQKLEDLETKGLITFRKVSGKKVPVLVYDTVTVEI